MPKTPAKPKKPKNKPKPRTPKPRPQPKVTFIEPEMVQIPAGDFIMGCIESKKGGIFGLRTIEQGRDDVEGGCDDNEKPVHKVRLPVFLLGKYPVTFDEFDAFCNATGFAKPDDEDWGRGNRPAWLAEVSGKPYRLPSEAEWEYAARANSDTAYPWGNKASHNHANYDWKIDKTTLVGNYSANAFGLYDMHGNVWEWIADAWHNDYQGAPTDGRVWGTAESTYRMLRGGSWRNNSGYVRSVVRRNFSSDSCYDYIGLRLALG